MEIILAILGSGALSALISGGFSLVSKLIDQSNAKKEKNDSNTARFEKIEKQLHKAEVDNVRLQMMVLMSDYPEDQAELMRCAEHYFRDLKGNWFMTGLFNRYLKENNIAEPEWFGHEND